MGLSISCILRFLSFCLWTLARQCPFIWGDFSSVSSQNKIFVLSFLGSRMMRLFSKKSLRRIMKIMSLRLPWPRALFSIKKSFGYMNPSDSRDVLSGVASIQNNNRISLWILVLLISRIRLLVRLPTLCLFNGSIRVWQLVLNTLIMLDLCMQT